MKKIFLALAALACLINYVAKAQSPYKPTHSFSENLNGKLGKKVITMSLNVGLYSDSSISGWYFYHAIDTPLYLQGKITHAGIIELTESYKGSETGNFAGKFDDSITLTGLWTSRNGLKKLPFVLHRSEKGSAYITYQKYSSSNCDLAEKNKADTSNKNLSYYDTTCTTLELSIAHIETGNPTIDSKINEDISEAIMKDCNCSLNGSELTYSDEEASLGVEVQIIYNDNYVLSCEFSEGEYALGAAHGEEDYYYLDYNLKTGETITLDEVLKPGYMDVIDSIAEKSGDTDGGDMPDMKEAIGQEGFSITATGLTFCYHAGHIAGNSYVDIPYSALTDLIRPDGPLNKFINRKTDINQKDNSK